MSVLTKRGFRLPLAGGLRGGLKGRVAKLLRIALMLALPLPLPSAAAETESALPQSYAPAPAAAADWLGHLHLSGSERLRLRGLGLAFDQGLLSAASTGFFRRELTAQGYDAAGPLISAKRFSLAPLLSYDGNINGGLLHDRLILGGLVFEADPAFRAKAGLIAGLSLGAMARFAWAEGRVIEVTGASELAWSPRHEIGRADAMLSLCARNHLRDWWFLDLCAKEGRTWRELTDARSQSYSLGGSKVFAGFGGVQEAGLRLERAEIGERAGRRIWQERLQLSFERLGPGGVFSLAVLTGRKLTDETVLRHRLDLSWSMQALPGSVLARLPGEDWQADLWLQEAEGSRFLGVPRRDRAFGAALSFSPRPGVSLRLGLSRNLSTAVIATYDQLSVNVRFSDVFR